MKNHKLEEFVKANREEFDFLEPSPEVWNRIQSAKKEKKTIRLRSYVLRAAAVIAVALISSVALWELNILNTGNYSSGITDPELMELIEAESFYAHQVDTKLKEIRKCYYTFPELKHEVEADLIELEEMYQTLKTDLKDNVSNKAVIEAMIENNRYRLKLVDDVLEQINC